MYKSLLHRLQLFACVYLNYLAFLHHCMQLAPDYADHYRFDALFSDELRQKYPYKQGDAEKYVQLFKKITR